MVGMALKEAILPTVLYLLEINSNKQNAEERNKVFEASPLTSTDCDLLKRSLKLLQTRSNFSSVLGPRSKIIMDIVEAWEKGNKYETIKQTFLDMHSFQTLIRDYYLPLPYSFEKMLLRCSVTKSFSFGTRRLRPGLENSTSQRFKRSSHHVEASRFESYSTHFKRVQ